MTAANSRPIAEVVEGAVHALDLANHLDRIAGRELLLQLVDDFADVAATPPRSRS